MEGIIGAAAGIFVTGLVNYFLKKQEFKFQKKEVDRRDWTSKIEQLHIHIIEALNESTALIQTATVLGSASDMSYSSKHAAYATGLTAVQQKYSLCTSELRLHASEALPAWNEALEAGKRLLEASAPYMLGRIRVEDLDLLMDDLNRNTWSAVKAVEALRTDRLGTPEFKLDTVK